MDWLEGVMGDDPSAFVFHSILSLNKSPPHLHLAKDITHFLFQKKLGNIGTALYSYII